MRNATRPTHGHAIGLAQPVRFHALLRGHRVIPVEDAASVQERCGGQQGDGGWSGGCGGIGCVRCSTCIEEIGVDWEMDFKWLSYMIFEEYIVSEDR